MKRLQIMIEEELDDALGRLAVAEGVSKAALVRGSWEMPFGLSHPSHRTR